MPRFRTWSFGLLAAASVGLAACSSSSTAAPTTAPPTTTAPTTAAPATTAPATTAPATSGPAAATAAPIPAADRSAAGTTGKEPTVTVPPGAAPTQLESADLIVGSGPSAKAGDKLTVQYVLATYSSRKVVQSSWSSQPFTFTLGAGQVIPGWDEGVVGMQAGGRRELIIPPSLGYGDQAPGPGIATNDTLVFVVDVININ